MDPSPSPLFRPVAVGAASGTQIGPALATHWRGVAVFTALAFALFAALIAFVGLVEHAPVQRVAAVVDTRPLIVKLSVAPSAIASMQPGIELRLAFRDYPPERYGLFAAKVDSVDAVVAVASLPGELRGPHGEALPLRPGMLADALVPGERRSVLAWLLEPTGRGTGADARR